MTFSCTAASIIKARCTRKLRSTFEALVSFKMGVQQGRRLELPEAVLHMKTSILSSHTPALNDYDNFHPSY